MRLAPRGAFHQPSRSRALDASTGIGHERAMTLASSLLLATSTLVFVGAASTAKAWALSANSMAWLVATLALYTIGNLIMLRLIRDLGMGVALSLSAVVQLVAVNLVAFAVFGERLSAIQSTGIVLAIISVAMITLFPAR